MASLSVQPAVTLGARARFTACVFAGSFLLFLVQPMIARMALPRLGGAPAVWNSAMLVYQALLLAGYAYAHFLGRLAPRRQAMVHLALFTLAALTLPIALADMAPPPDANIFLWVPWLLLVSIGPLFLVVSAQAPLMQRWFALSGGGDPYPLYAASNLGSFLGLLAFPLIVEPLLPVAAQSLAWSFGYGTLALLVAGCALLLPKTSTTSSATTPTVPRPTRREIGRWIALSAIPSGLMLSTTLHLTTDIVAMPLLWVLPLGLYLLSFSIAFSQRRRLADAMIWLAPPMLIFAAFGLYATRFPYPVLLALLALVALLVVASAIHAMLFDRRPDPAHLTIFYLATSVGGVLGGLFCALIAPLSFDWSFEHPLLIAAAGAALAPLNPIGRLRLMWSQIGSAPQLSRGLAVAALMISVAGSGSFGLPYNKSLTVAAGALLMFIALAAIGRRWLFGFTLAALLMCLGGWDKLAVSVDDRMTRSFFGIYSIRDMGRDGRMLVHGTTVHGVQNLGSADRQRMTTSYYAPRSGVGLAMRAAPSVFPKARVGIVGLGAGTLACASSPGQFWRFYEIDPVVADIARDPARFSFLSQCQPNAPVIIGDARLTLARAAAASADILVIDAFSSDSVPMHLLTREAFTVYGRHLVANGLLMVHVSNRYLDLVPVVAAAATAQGWQARQRLYHPTRAERADRAGGSLWIMLSRAPATVAAVERSSGADGWTALPASGSAPWTDDHATILPIIKWRG